MRRILIPALVVAIVGGVLSASLDLGKVASYGLMVLAIALTLPFVLGVSREDVRARMQRR